MKNYLEGVAIVVTAAVIILVLVTFGPGWLEALN